MRGDVIVNKVLWILAPAAVLGLVVAVPSTGCAKTASDCAAQGLPVGCTPGNFGGAGGADAGSDAGNDSAGGAGGAGGMATGGAGGMGAGGSTLGTVCEAKRAGDAADQTARSLSADAAGHLLVGGDFQGTLAFGVSQLTASTTSGFLALFDATTLKPSWSRSIPATYLASVLDASGNVIVAGRYTGAPDVGCGPLDPAKTFFLAKIDPTKAPQSSCVFSMAYAAPMVLATLAVAANGDIVLAGASQGQAELGGGSLPAYGGQDVIAARFTSAGAPLWSNAYGTSGDEAASGLALDPVTGDAFVTGDFAGVLDFATGKNSLDSGAGKRDIFIAAFDAGGVPLWAEQFKGPNDDHATGIAVVSDGVLVGGDYTGSIDLGTNHETSAMASAFVVGKLELADGAAVWTTTLDGKGNGAFAALAATEADGLVLTGSVTVDASNAGLLVAALDKKGVPLHETTFPGAGLSRGLAVATHAGVVDVAGGFGGTLDLGAAGKLQSNGGQDVFLAHLCP
jgi:hypothetical protein